MKRGFTVLVLLFIVACLEPAAQPVHKPAGPAGRSYRNNGFFTDRVSLLISQGMWEMALAASDTALRYRDDAVNNFQRAVIFSELGDDTSAILFFEKALKRDRLLTDARLALAGLLLQRGDISSALKECNQAIRYDGGNAAVYRARAAVWEASGDSDSALGDLSAALMLEPGSQDHFAARALCYQRQERHQEAAADLTAALAKGSPTAAMLLMRARSYDALSETDRAAADYAAVIGLSRGSAADSELRREAEERLFAINREEESPEIILERPPVTKEGHILLGPHDDRIIVSGSVTDQSPLALLTVNEKPVNHGGKSTVNFETEVAPGSRETLHIVARDVYDNETVLTCPITRTENDPPLIEILDPQLMGENLLMVEDDAKSIDIQGVIRDESLIRSVRVGNVSAQFPLDDLNPQFIARGIDVRNKDRVTIEAEDIYGNMTVSRYTLNRAGTIISENNPMGNTLVVFIENSDYEDFAVLQGPPKDASLITSVLEENYQVLPVKRLRNQSKQQMEKFFSIDLRDEIRNRQIKSLVVWYAGHGKFINDVGYWIPVDARRDEEFSYFSLNSLKASMETYMNYLTHLLVITDACESGPSFYQTMRSELRVRDCTDWRATQLKSGQLFSSAGYELATDDSQFTRTFAAALRANPNTCISIEEIVIHVTKAVTLNNQQKPRFGRITGLKDEDGTFFFVKK